MKKVILFLYILFAINLYSKPVNIAVAANMSYAIVDIVKAFNKKYPDVKINTMLGSSGKLTAQILHGAPFDLFFSANMKYPLELYNKGFALSKPTVYAKGALILFSSKPRDFKKGFKLLFDKQISKIAVANPKTAPYGIATKEVLDKKGIYNVLKSKFVFGESIGQTLIFTVKVCDMGFIAKSALGSKIMKQYKENINYITIDPTLHNPINQGVVVLKHSQNNNDVVKFYNFIFSNQGKKILEKFGYITL